MDLTSHVDGQLALMREEAEELFERGGTCELHRAVFAASGKLLRPRLVLLCAALGDPDWTLARRAALAIELLHVGTLYHDDLVDRSATRRGQPSVHIRLGSEVAALGGLHLLCLGNSLAARLPDPLPMWWGRAMLQVADGQLRETERAGSVEIRPAEYEHLARLKTASLFGLAARFGGRFSGLGPECEELLRQLGSDLGLAFQLIDDLDDFVAEANEHRAPTTDLRERIYTLAVLYGCSGGDTTATLLRDLLQDNGQPLPQESISVACRLLADTGAFDAASQRAMSFVERALSFLGPLPPGPARQSLQQLIEGLRPPGLRWREAWP